MSDFLAIRSPWSARSAFELAREGHAQQLQQPLRFFVGLGSGDDAHLKAAKPVDLVVVDLGKCELLAQPERVVATAVERPGRDAAEVADAWEGQPSQTLEEVPHALATQRDLGADGVARAQPELGNGL